MDGWMDGWGQGGAEPSSCSTTTCTLPCETQCSAFFTGKVVLYSETGCDTMRPREPTCTLCQPQSPALLKRFVLGFSTWSQAASRCVVAKWDPRPKHRLATHFFIQKEENEGRLVVSPIFRKKRENTMVSDLGRDQRLSCEPMAAVGQPKAVVGKRWRWDKMFFQKKPLSRLAEMQLMKAYGHTDGIGGRGAEPRLLLPCTFDVHFSQTKRPDELAVAGPRFRPLYAL